MTARLFSGDNSEEALVSTARRSLPYCKDSLTLCTSLILLLILATLNRMEGVLNTVSAFQQSSPFAYLWLSAGGVSSFLSERYTSEEQTGVTESAN